MKVETKETEEFKPVVITLESMVELESVCKAMGMVDLTNYTDGKQVVACAHAAILRDELTDMIGKFKKGSN